MAPSLLAFGPLQRLTDGASPAFHLALEEVLSAYPPDVSAAWTQDMGLPRSVFADAGSADLFRHRWKPGATAGVAHALAMVGAASACSSGLALGWLTHSEVFIAALERHASTAAQREVLDAALDGTAVGAFAVTEDVGGSELLTETTATPTSGGWKLQGRKRYVSNGRCATHVLVLARTEGEPAGRDLSLFLVPTERPGIRVDGIYPKSGMHACDTARLSFDVELDADLLVGVPGLGPVYVARALQFERLAIAGLMLCGARRALRLATAFARSRPSGDGVVLDRQAMRHRLALDLVEIHAAEAMLVDVVDHLDEPDRGARTAACKVLAATTACRIFDDCLQAFGGRGYTTNFPIEQWWRDARVGRIGGGTDEVMLDMVGETLRRRDPDFESWVDELLVADEPVDAR